MFASNAYANYYWTTHRDTYMTQNKVVDTCIP